MGREGRRQTGLRRNGRKTVEDREIRRKIGEINDDCERKKVRESAQDR